MKRLLFAVLFLVPSASGRAATGRPQLMAGTTPVTAAIQPAAYLRSLTNSHLFWMAVILS